MRRGIRAIVGGSLGEIFFGKRVMLGIPCLTVSQADLEWRQKAVERAPKEPVHVEVEKQEVRFGNRVIEARIPDGPRNRLVQGTWDSTAVLLEAGAAIEATATNLPYVAGFWAKKRQPAPASARRAGRIAPRAPRRCRHGQPRPCSP